MKITFLDYSASNLSTKYYNSPLSKCVLYSKITSCLMVINISWWQRIKTCRIRPRVFTKKYLERLELHIPRLTGSFLSVLLLINVSCLVRKVHSWENAVLGTYRSTHWFIFSRLIPLRAWFWNMIKLIPWFIAANLSESTLDGYYLNQQHFHRFYLD